MKKFLIWLTLSVTPIFLASCDENIRDSKIFERCGTFLCVKDSIKQKLRDNPEIIIKLERNANEGDRLFNPDKAQDLIKNGLTLDGYISAIKKYQESITDTCSDLESNEKLSSNEKDEVKKQCTDGNIKIAEKIKELDTELKSCSVSDIGTNSFIQESINSVSYGNDKINGFTYSNYKNIKSKFIESQISRMEDPLLKKLKYDCINSFINNNNGIDIYYLIAGNLYLSKNNKSELEGTGTLINALKNDISFQEARKKFRQSFKDNYENWLLGEEKTDEKVKESYKHLPPIVIKKNDGTCDSVCENDFGKISQKIDESIGIFLEKGIELTYLNILRDGFSCYKGKDCYIYVKDASGILNQDENTFYFTVDGEKRRGIQAVYNTLDYSGLYEIQIANNDLWGNEGIIGNKNDSINFSIIRVNNTDIDSNTITIYINELRNEQSLAVKKQGLSGIKIPLYGKPGTAEITVNVDGYQGTEASIGFDGTIPKKLDFDKLLGISLGVGYEVEVPLKKGFNAGSDGNGKGTFESKRKYKYEYQGKDGDLKNQMLFINTFLDDLGYGGEIAGQVSVLQKSEKLTFDTIKDDLSDSYRRSISLNYIPLSIKGLINEEINWKKDFNPCTSNAFTNFSILDSLGCAWKADASIKGEAGVDSILLSASINGKINGGLSKGWKYSKTDKVMTESSTSAYYDWGANAEAKSVFGLIPKLISLFSNIVSFDDDTIIKELNSISEWEGRLANMSFFKNSYKSETVKTYSGSFINKIEQTFTSDINQDSDNYSVTNEFNLKVKFSFEDTTGLNETTFDNNIEKVLKNDVNNKIAPKLSDLSTLKNGGYSYFGDISNDFCHTEKGYSNYKIDFSILSKNSSFSSSFSTADLAKIVPGDAEKLTDKDRADIASKMRSLRKDLESSKMKIKRDIKGVLTMDKDGEVTLLDAIKACNSFKTSKPTGNSAIDCSKVWINLGKVIEDSGLYNQLKYRLEQIYSKPATEDIKLKKLLEHARYEKTREYELETPLASFSCQSGILYKNYIENSFDTNGFELIEKQIQNLTQSLKDSISLADKAYKRALINNN